MSEALGQFAEGCASWRRMLAAVSEDNTAVRWQIYSNAAHEIASYVAHGLVRQAAVDELQEIAEVYGLAAIDADTVQQIVSDAFARDQVPDELDEGNGHDQEAGHALRASPFVLPELSTMPKRALLYSGHYVRKVATATVAPGGWGKTTLALYEAVCMAVQGLRVWYLSGEDPLDEIARRIAAHCLQHGVLQGQLDGQLFVDDRETFALMIGKATRNGVAFDEPWLGRFEAAIIADDIDVVIIDPFVSFHTVAEGDNGAIDAVVKRLAAIAARCNCCIELSHHVRKAQYGQTELTVDDTRGGSAIVNAVRSCRVINRMSEREADLAQIPYDKRASYLRLDKGKRNMAPPEAAAWFLLKSVVLPNGDNVQAIEPWEFPAAFDGLSSVDVLWVQALLRQQPHRTSSQCEDWLGHAIGTRFSRDTATKAGAIWAQKIISTWLGNKVFKKAPMRDPETRKMRSFYVANDYRSPAAPAPTQDDSDEE